MYLASLLKVILQLIPIAILVFFLCAVIAVVKQLDRIGALLREIRNRCPELENAPGKLLAILLRSTSNWLR